jgi:hypothetical protein
MNNQRGEELLGKICGSNKANDIDGASKTHIRTGREREREREREG